MSEHLQIDDVNVEVRRSARRSIVDLAVDRDGSVVIAVPEKLEMNEIKRIIRSKLPWVYTTLGRKQATEKGPPPKEYVSGEGFYYLGRKYRLKLVSDGAADRVNLENGRFFLARALAPRGRELFVAWYSERASEWIGRRVQSLRARVAAEPQNVEIRDLGFRWGSCTHRGRLFFHWRTVLLPPEQIDFLIQHELVHIHEHNHSTAFYDRLRRAVPDYKAHEAWFRKNGDLYSL